MKTATARLLLFGLSLGLLLGLAHEAKSATVLYAMTENGLLYRSADGAKTWQNIALPGAPTLAIFSALAVDPENSSNLYVDVSPADRPHPGAPTNYFFRSADGGATWSQSDPPRTAELLAVDPASSNIVYLGTAGGLFRSTDSGVTWSATSISTFVDGISTDAHHAGVVYVTTTDGKIYKSTDFGATWTLLTSSLPPGFNRLLNVAADPNNSSVLWGTGEGSCVVNNVGFSCGLVQSTDGGKTWQAISSVKGWFKNVVIDSQNGNIYAGGEDTSQPIASRALAVKSADGGKTWTKITQGMSKYGVEVHLDPENAATLYAEQANLPGTGDLGPGGGVYVSTNGGASWTLNPVDASQGQNDLVLGLAAVSSKTAADSPPAIASVVNAAGFQPGLVANSCVTIQGTNLAPQTDDWSKSIVNGALPTFLDGVSVSMGGKPAYVYYVSPGQLNVLAPDIAAGSVTVTVTTAGGTSASFTSNASLYGPAFFLWPGSQVVATRQDYSYAVKAGTFAGASTVAAKPGEVLILWATGFGPTMPAAPLGLSVPASGAYSAASSPTVTINNTPAIVYGAALAPGSAGLYQIAIQVPNTLADGDWPIQASIGGATSPSGIILSVAH